MEIWQAIILGIVEGITEFLPVSSTGHLIITNALLRLSGDATAAFDVCIQGGAILAVMILFKDRFVQLAHVKPLTNLHFAVAAAVIPFLIAGALLGSSIKQNLFGLEPVAYGLIIGGVLLILAGNRYPLTNKADDATSMSPTLWQGCVVGICQLGALWPGMSRAACTMIGGLVAGMPLSASAEFSFLVAVPILLAASAHDGLKAIATFSQGDLVSLAIGFFVSFICAFATVGLFLRLLRSIGLKPFGWYRLILGITILFLLNR